MGSVTPSSASFNASAMPASTSLRPTIEGYVADTKDALTLFEAVLQGVLPRVSRRPHDRERSSLIKSGSVFIYEEGASGIKRWTDGVPWSPSRILNNFLIYRELEKPFPPGEKKRAAKKPKRSVNGDGSPPDGAESGFASPVKLETPTSPLAKPDGRQEGNQDRDQERSLVGSLTDSYAFKDNGLIKKTMSVQVDGTHYHMVSYYNPEDVKRNTLRSVMLHESIRFLKVRGELLHRQNFRSPIEDVEDPMHAGNYQMHGHFVSHHPASYMQPQQGYMQQAAFHPYAMQMQPHPQQHAGYPPDRGNPMTTAAFVQHQQYYTAMAQQQQQQQQQQPQQQQPQQQHQPQLQTRNPDFQPHYGSYSDQRSFADPHGGMYKTEGAPWPYPSQ